MNPSDDNLQQKQAIGNSSIENSEVQMAQSESGSISQTQQDAQVINNYNYFHPVKADIPQESELGQAISPPNHSNQSEFSTQQQSFKNAIKNQSSNHPIMTKNISVKVFISYSHRDEDLMHELVKHLSLLKRQGVIQDWHDRQITAGSEWAGEINENLRSAQVILLLVSSDFLASNYCYDLEMKTALDRYKMGDAIVIPIILRPVSWQDSPLGKLQALPKDGRAITQWSDRDEAFLNVEHGIRKVIDLDFSKIPNLLEIHKEKIGVDRNELLEDLIQCPDAVFNKTVFYSKAPGDILPPEIAAQSNRAIKLIEWAGSTNGIGLSKLYSAYLRASKKIL